MDDAIRYCPKCLALTTDTVCPECGAETRGELRMEVVENDLEAGYCAWEDPGDYPCGAAGSPLPSYGYVDEVLGAVKVRVSFEKADLLEALGNTARVTACDTFADVYRRAVADLVGLWLSEFEGKATIILPDCVDCVEWEIELDERCETATLIPASFEARTFSLSKRRQRDYDY